MGLRDYFRAKMQKVSEKRKEREAKETVWIKCDSCGEVSYTEQVDDNFNCCPQCQFHFKVTGRDKIGFIIDEGSFREMDAKMHSLDPLKFKDSKKYPDRIRAAMKKSGLSDAFVSGAATVHGIPVHIGAMEFDFLGGSMGSVVGEKITRLIEAGVKNNTHVITISASGGARMQESILSLMQMAKTSAALQKLAAAKKAHISILTDPTTGGVTASFSMLGDVHIAEPGALIGFAGPRVIEQTIRQKLPEGFQRSEFLLDHGMVDMVLHRKDWRPTIKNLLEFFG